MTFQGLIGESFDVTVAGQICPLKFDIGGLGYGELMVVLSCRSMRA